MAYSPNPDKPEKKKIFYHETRKCETTKKTMKLFVVFRFRVFVIAFTIFATKYTNFTVKGLKY